MQPYKCPVCDGTGKVPAGFYNEGYGSTNACPEQCQTCKGIGIVLPPQPVYVPSIFGPAEIPEWAKITCTSSGSEVYITHQPNIRFICSLADMLNKDKVDSND
jgi:hypothetical protein